MNKADYALIGIAVAGLLMVGIPIAVSAEIPLAFGQITNSTLTNSTNTNSTITNSTITNSTITNSTISTSPEPVIEEPVTLPTGSISITKYTHPTDSFENLVRTTYGSNYNLIEDYNTGQAKWTSHPERIMNGSWQNYVLEADSQKIIFYSNSIGTFVYDVPSCSYSIYENGYNGNQIIPSVSSVATSNVNGVWSNLPVNDELCDVSVTEHAYGVDIVSTKTLALPDISFTNSNGTIITMPNTQTFVDEIKLDINSGIKETFKVWSTDDNPLGISQTVHTGESITVGGNTIDIASFNGQSFDKQFLEDNQAQIFEIAENLNYDFDLGFDSLSGLNIYHDTDYKVNLDYAEGGFVNYLEIDPTFTQTTSSDKTLAGDQNQGCSPTSGTIMDHATEQTLGYLYPNFSPYDKCYRSYIEFDISMDSFLEWHKNNPESYYTSEKTMYVAVSDFLRSTYHSASINKNDENKNIVTILCDSGSRYQTKLYNKDFLVKNNLPCPEWI